jgi:glutathione synthase/RimK-type ligase-like ATP-grasp enzyme
MRVAILAARQGWHTEELCRALVARHCEPLVLAYEALVGQLGAGPGSGLTSGGESLDTAAAVLPRIIPAGSLEQIIFRMDALHRLEDAAIPVMNSPRALERTVDKFWTTALLEQAGLPVPETIVCERAEDAMAAFRALGDMIVKPLFGSMGLGMVRVSDEVAMNSFIPSDDVALNAAVYYLNASSITAGTTCARLSSATV